MIRISSVILIRRYFYNSHSFFIENISEIVNFVSISVTLGTKLRVKWCFVVTKHKYKELNYMTLIIKNFEKLTMSFKYKVNTKFYNY